MDWHVQLALGRPIRIPCLASDANVQLNTCAGHRLSSNDMKPKRQVQPGGVGVCISSVFTRERHSMSAL